MLPKLILAFAGVVLCAVIVYCSGCNLHEQHERERCERGQIASCPVTPGR